MEKSSAFCHCEPQCHNVQRPSLCKILRKLTRLATKPHTLHVNVTSSLCGLRVQSPCAISFVTKGASTLVFCDLSGAMEAEEMPFLFLPPLIFQSLST